jgi:flagellar capping protein FliD
MASTYLDLIEKLQEQGLETLKTAQTSYINSLTAVRELVEKLPTAPQLPTIEGFPTLAQLTELNTQFLDRVSDQQKAYAKQLADVFAPLEKKTDA